MVSFDSSLLREKFTIHEPESPGTNSDGPLIALSNRMVVDLRSRHGSDRETFIVRAQNMHSCVRMSAHIVRAFYTAGPLMDRTEPFDWEACWSDVVNKYEHTFNPQRWVAVYYKGRPVYEWGDRHLFLDVIEKCDARNKNEYDKSIPLAEEAFKQTGHSVSIDHDSNVALVINMQDTEAKCGVILRGPSKTTTFNFSVHPDLRPVLDIPQVMMGAAAFLEGIQLAFMIGMNNEKTRLGILDRRSKEEKQTREAERRLSQLNSEISNLESICEIHYRPERPQFPHLIIDAERLARKILAPKDENNKENKARVD